MNVAWRKQVYKNFSYKCDICGKKGKGGKLIAHHLNSWNSYKDQRYDINNGTCMCPEHHKMFHDEYGYGDNTEKQYKEFKKSIKMLDKS